MLISNCVGCFQQALTSWTVWWPVPATLRGLGDYTHRGLLLAFAFLVCYQIVTILHTHQESTVLCENPFQYHNSRSSCSGFIFGFVISKIKKKPERPKPTPDQKQYRKGFSWLMNLICYFREVTERPALHIQSQSRESNALMVPACSHRGYPCLT